MVPGMERKSGVEGECNHSDAERVEKSMLAPLACAASMLMACAKLRRLI